MMRPRKRSVDQGDTGLEIARDIVKGFFPWFGIAINSRYIRRKSQGSETTSANPDIRVKADTEKGLKTRLRRPMEREDAEAKPREDAEAKPREDSEAEPKEEAEAET
ncbi:hypothetical protein NDU88_005486 [Pleurodeles waltl]|uniref:Uncharacterized protein n=1 Tax=Pleurodeles waltl TaxID=8319 RepID=A0AAV7NMX4_PLEWA|nr:hypothetical protein NDU88_005486 [Pleurodeles waltl]